MAPRPVPISHGYDHGVYGSDRIYRPRSLLVTIDGMGAEISEGVAGEATVHYPCEIISWRLLADIEGDIIVDIWKADYASYPPTALDSITGTEQPTLTGTDKDESSTLADWVVDVNPGDTFRFNVDSITDITRVLLTLHLRV